ncbi:threonine/serine dehydratase [Alkalicaulis satelles]|uniref:Threonine/serine dehydratase n=1 Tax=Alkalicaulis satelles TaxID=2609175 RepID=A0A5M6ZI44_9PROT|nr:threonine/serine dehydratase [Alkalicaulis satelles]KAA5804439.1 threonine/serine dehydratase [Alkalicaulis satelles]
MTTHRLPDFNDVTAAAARLAGHAVRTPLLSSPALDELTGARILVKAEPLQRTGSFKFRGAWNALSQLSEAQRARGVVAFSSGNHAQGVAEAARLLGVHAIIVMPSDAPAIKQRGVIARGAELRLYDRETESREAIAREISETTGAALIPSFDHPHIIAGQGTAGLELFEDMAARGLRADTLVCCLGGGGLIGGINLAAAALSPQTEVWGAEPEGFDDHARSLVSGRRERNARQSGSLCDALLSESPGALTFAINQTRLAGVAVISDADALHAMRAAFEHLKLVLEPGGAAALAAVLSGRVEVKGRTVVVIASGGNVDPAVFARALA